MAETEKVSAPPSMQGQKEEKPPPGKLASFLTLANQYKELATLVVAIVFGVLWVFAYFATKQQLKQSQCITNANLGFIQAQMDSTSLSQLMTENTKESISLDAKASLTPEEMLKRNQLKTGAAEITAKSLDATNRATQALNKLKNGDCVSD
jgi:cytoskeletal protein RodZ